MYTTTISRIALYICAAIIATALGCTVGGSYGNRISATAVQQIVKGKTTRSEIETQFGTPTSVTMTGDGKRVLMYMFMDNKTSNVTPLTPLFGTVNRSFEQQMLQVTLTKNDIVEDYHFSDSSMNTEQQMKGFTSTAKPVPTEK